MVGEEVLTKISAMSTGPGVYLWHDEYKRIIYVGKAVNLRSRVRSYIRKDSNRSPKVEAMMRVAKDVEVIQTKTEMEALLLECTLIKQHHPKYNILLRDDKTYPYIKVTVQEEFPRLFMTRKRESDKAKYFGPFTDVGAVHSTLKVLHQIFPIRNCKSMRVERPCLQYHMSHCEAPCMGYVKKEDYKKHIDAVLDLLEGRSTTLVEGWKREMEEASEMLQFEKAMELRDRIRHVEKLQEKQYIATHKGELDVVGLAIDKRLACLQIFFIRNGHLVGRENFFAQVEQEGAIQVMTELLKQYYSIADFAPKEVLVPIYSEEFALMEEWLTSVRGSKVAIQVPQRGYKKNLLLMAQENAQTFLEDRKRQWQHQVDKASGAVEKLAEVLDLPRLPDRMECFDISHMQGSETVASMVVFKGGKAAKKEYRRFKLKTVQGKPDDFKSMAEIMERRYGKKRDWPMPDLIIIDGGKGQLQAALPIIREAGVTDVPVISLAKRLEEVFVEGRQESILLEHHSPELQLLQQIRDEAHRFAITYHRSLRGKRNMESILEHIEGVGPKRRKILWQTYASLEDMKNASIEELASLEGMNQKVAERLYTFFRLKKEDKQQIVKVGNRSNK